MIVVKDISKTFDGIPVLNRVSFHIAPLECVGIIGKNGAGKTTLLNMMSGILKPDSGFLRVNACQDILADRQTLRMLSYVSGTKSQLWRDMKLVYSFEYCRQMYGISKTDYVKRLEALTEILDIGDCLSVPVMNLSLGQRIRGELAYALLSEPELLFLDEALIGLDISVKDRIMKFLAKIKEDKKTTILYTSHNLMEMESLCDRVILLDKGSIIFDGTVENIMNQFAPEYRMDIEVTGNLPDLEDLPVKAYRIKNSIMSLRYNKQKIETAAVMKHMIHRCVVKNIKIVEPKLEDTIKKIYERNGEI